MADAYTAGLAFRNFLSNALPAAGNVVLNAALPARPALQAVAPSIGDFLSGAINGPQNSVTVPLPPARVKNANGYVAPPPGNLGVLSPAAAKVLGQQPGAQPAAVAAPAAPAANPNLAALGNLSFRQLMSLGDFSEKTRGLPVRPVSAADQAGNLLLQSTYPTLQNSLKAAKDDNEKQKLIDDYRDKVLLPIISHGNPMAGILD